MEKEKLIALVSAAKQGDELATTELYEAFHQDLFFHIRKTVNDPSLAEDLLQDTFIEIFQTLPQLQEPAAFVTWAKQIAYHRCTAYFKKRREILADEDEDGYSVFDTIEEDRTEFIPDEALDQEDLKQTIHGIIGELPTEQRSAILMRYFDEISVKEIADIQGVSEGTVKSRLNYGRKSIKEAVENYEKKNGIKLHCVGVIPLLLWLFRAYAKENGIVRTATAASAAYTTANSGAATAVAAKTAVEAAGGAATTAGAATATATATTVGTAAGSAAVAKTVTVLGIKVALTKLIAGVVAAALVVGGAVTGISVAKNASEKGGSSRNSVNLNDYVKITTSGYDGYGQLSATIDTEQLIKDYSKYLTDESLDTQYFGDKTPELAANFVFTAYNPYELAYEAGTNLKNGDKIEFSWNTSESAIQTLRKILKVKIKFSNFTYTVKDLEALVECDPFEKIDLTFDGLSPNGYFSSYTYNNRNSSATVRGETISFSLSSDKVKGIANGDTLHLTVSETPEYYAENYGIILTRTETDVVVENIDYLPQENPEDIFTYITDKSFNNILSILQKQYGHYAGEMKYEYVGGVYYYDDDLSELYSNSLYLIYHLDNGIYPGGWYIALSPRSDEVIVRHFKQADGTILKTTTFKNYYKSYEDDVLLSTAGNYNIFPYDTFKYDGLSYTGAKSLETCLKKIVSSYNPQDHMVVTDSLSQYLEEY